MSKTIKFENGDDVRNCGLNPIQWFTKTTPMTAEEPAEPVVFPELKERWGMDEAPVANPGEHVILRVHGKADDNGYPCEKKVFEQTYVPHPTVDGAFYKPAPQEHMLLPDDVTALIASLEGDEEVSTATKGERVYICIGGKGEVYFNTASFVAEHKTEVDAPTATA